MKKTTIAILAAGLVLTTGSLAVAFGNGPGGRHMMFGPGMGGPMMHGGPGMGGPMMQGRGMRGSMRGNQIFKEADKNNDGVVTREEALAMGNAKFSTFDTNNDGAVDAAEIDKAMSARLERVRVAMRYRLLSHLDSNGDGKVSKEEFNSKGMSKFELADANNDDKVTSAEMQALRGKAGRYFSRRGHGPRWGGRQNRRGMGGTW